jgi:hypothetical protein
MFCHARTLRPPLALGSMEFPSVEFDFPAPEILLLQNSCHRCTNSRKIERERHAQEAKKQATDNPNWNHPSLPDAV